MPELTPFTTRAVGNPQMIDIWTLEHHTTIVADECGIKPERWDALLKKIEPLKTHSPRMYAHSLRVGLYSTLLADLEGLDMKLALHGGCAHDVGKCYVAVDVIEANPYGPEQHAIMKFHAESGYRYLVQSHPMSAMIAGLHHTFQDDPYGIDLSGGKVLDWMEEQHLRKIIQMAQLVACCDFFDAAMTRGESKTPKQVAVMMRNKLHPQVGTEKRIDSLHAVAALSKLGKRYWLR